MKNPRAVRSKPVVLGGLVALLLAVAAVVTANLAHAAVTTAISVDFTKVVAATPAQSIGFTATTFGVEGGPVPTSAADIAALKALGAGSVRIHLKPDAAGNIVSGAAGGDSSISGSSWLSAYEQIGAAPTVIVNLDTNDALAVLNYVRATHHDVRRYIVGNEMDANSKSNVTKAVYAAKFGDIAAAMRAIDPTLLIGAPAPAYFEALDQQWVSTLVSAPGTRKASFIDYHAYGAGDGQAAAMDTAWRYAGQLSQLRSWIGDPSVGMQVGEYNMNWGNDPQNNTQTQTVWVAAALGTILSNGAVAFQYGDKNNAMGLVANGQPKASYWGIGMFTGASRFRHFGASMVQSTSGDSVVRVFASTGEKNIVVVNTGGATHANVAMSGFADGTAQVWQSTNLTPARQADAGVSAGSLGLDLPAKSVTTLVLTGTGSPPPTPSPTAAPTASASATASPAPTTSPTPAPTPTTHGLAATYFDNMDLTGPTVTRVDPTVNFTWGQAAPAPGIGADTFSVRWTGQVLVDTAGSYTFTTTSDDGIRLWVDGAPLVDDWSNHSNRDDHGTATLTAGRHDIRVEYYDNTFDATARLAWSGPGVTTGTVPTDHLFPTPVASTVAHGLTGAYFNTVDLTGSPVTHVDSTVNFNWGTAAPLAGIHADNFSVRWTGQVQPSTTETYTFRTSSDDGVRLWVNGQLVIDHWPSHSWTDDTAAVPLVAGHRYDLRMEYYEKALTAVAILRWSSPTVPLQVIPAANLWTAAG